MGSKSTIEAKCRADCRFRLEFFYRVLIAINDVEKCICYFDEAAQPPVVQDHIGLLCVLNTRIDRTAKSRGKKAGTIVIIANNGFMVCLPPLYISKLLGTRVVFFKLK